MFQQDLFLDTYNLKGNIVDITMSHQTSNVFDTVAENATNTNDKFDNVQLIMLVLGVVFRSVFCHVSGEL